MGLRSKRGGQLNAVTEAPNSRRSGLTSMFDGIRSWMDFRRGSAQARYEIGILRKSNGKYAKEFLREAPRELSDPRSGFARGWDNEWANQGIDDALEGVYRGAVFRTESYEYGWVVGMRKMKRRGFVTERHSALLREILERRGEKLE